MTTVPTHPPAPSAQPRSETADRRPRRAAFAAAAGTAIEYYEFGVYGYLAVVIGPHFFPSDNPTASLLATLAVFGSAFLMRPIGGIVLGRLGDRLGRKPVLVVTVVGMGSATAAVGLLPTAASVGTAAPLALLLVRLVQGFFAGGEVTGSATYLAESAPPGKRGFFGAFTPVGVAVGGGTAALVAGTVTTVLSDAQLESYGWRIPFLLSIPLIAAALLARHRLEDSRPAGTVGRSVTYTGQPPLERVRHGVGRAVHMPHSVESRPQIAPTTAPIARVGAGFGPCQKDCEERRRCAESQQGTRSPACIDGADRDEREVPARPGGRDIPDVARRRPESGDWMGRSPWRRLGGVRRDAS
ncbi:MFS transporter [Streptomyces endophyticus]|uniref:MFS transporter n=1 Tax=Streptomyces endophyticus TaxID=714166 RepID=A0ABU6F877_9ACTN|nr:MFS transporter [Streptomyces endophyticus]MEB8340237.1 MFS transporter [Streptomyces endophyticus]